MSDDRSVKLRIQTLDAFFDDAIEGAKRIDAGDYTPQEAVVAFESADMFLSILTANRWRLLRALRKEGHSSIRHLAKVLERDYRGVHADVTALLNAGLIEKDEQGKIFCPYSKITAEMVFEDAA